MWYGADYYPEQWDAATLQEDMRLMKDMRVNTVTLGVFAWDRLEPRAGEFCFDFLDEAFALLAKNNVGVILATPTAGMPTWLTQQFPDLMRVTVEGVRLLPGARANFCPNHAQYRAHSQAIAGQLARRYGTHPLLRLWHVNNEYEHYCYCPECAQGFRDWLRTKYGTLAELNHCWSTSFWAHTLTDFEQIHPPSYRNETKPAMLGGRDISCFQAIELDYRRFMTASVAACIAGEVAAIRPYSQVPVTNNFAGLHRTFDCFTLARELDVISWDNYPTIETPAYQPAFTHDLMRSLKHQPFYVMEQTPNQILWRDACPVKRPGEVSGLCWQGAAHGADGNLFFQWRQSVGGVEKFHGAMVPHNGRIDTRMGHELTTLGVEFAALGGLLTGAQTRAKVALLFDWNSWWALECSSAYNNTLHYEQQVLKVYQALRRLGLDVEILNPEENLEPYRVLFAPCCYSASAGLSERLCAFVRGGGVLCTGFLSGIADENDRVTPGAWDELLGLQVEETDGLYPQMNNQILPVWGGAFRCASICDLLRPTTAEVLGVYGEDFYRGTPCLTINRFGAGAAYYLATDAEDALLVELAVRCCTDAGLAHGAPLPEGVELCRRYRDGNCYFFLLNHGARAQQVPLCAPCRDLRTGKIISGVLCLKPRETMILQRGEAAHGTDLL